MDPEVSPTPKRPVLVWIICIPFFVCTPFILLSLVMMLMMHLGLMPVPEHQREFIESQSNFDLGVTVLNDLMIPAWAILFFLLKRQSFYFFVGMLAFTVITATYSLLTEDLFYKIGVTGVAFIGICQALNLAVFYYNWHLFRKGILR